MFSNDSVQKHLRERFYVTPKAGLNFSGVLITKCKRYYVFADGKIHPDDGNPQPVVGEIYIERDNVAYLQRLPNVDG